MQESLSSSRVVARSAVFNAVGYAIAVLYAFLVIPLILHFLGTENFGIWSLAMALTGYIGLVDLGMTFSVTKYIAEYAAQEDRGKMNSVIRHGLLFYGLSAIAFLLIGLLVSSFVFRLLRVPPDQEATAQQALLLCLFGYGITSLTSVFFSVMNGLQRMDVSNILTSGTYVVRLLALGAALWWGGGLLGMLVADISVSAVALGAVTMEMRRVYPEFRLTLTPYDSSMMKSMVRFGAQLNVVRIAEQVQMNYDKFPIARYAGLTAVSLYDFGARPLTRLKAFPLTVLTTMLPTVSALHAEDHQERIQAALVRSTRYVIIVALPLFAFAAGLAPQLLEVWLGQVFPQAALALQILALAYLAGVVVGPLSFIAQGRGEPKYLMQSSVVQAVLNVVLSTFLARQFGFFGAVTGTLIASVVGAVVFVRMYAGRVISHPFTMLGRALLKPALCVVVASAAGITLARTMLNSGAAPSRGTVALVVVLAGLLLLAVYTALLIVTRTFSEDDRRFFRNILPAFGRGKQVD